ncbi:MAG: bifunctional histidinol-phosphatase/imidazoleglycerol-phosphate dehydratase HisB [Kofleriaceae bacterium]|nr:bifunctional histidinol-phosphatase/imidazoleglycerol-phosphate dehydratase HisB [Kofleriaceae bacterium]
MSAAKVLFVDRDGTILVEPEEDRQVDSLAKTQFVPGAIGALSKLSALGYRLVLVSNQDGLGTSSFPRETFEPPHRWMLETLRGEGVEFDEEFVCPHTAEDQCGCRKPRAGLLTKYLARTTIDMNRSYVIGDRDSDIGLAETIGVSGLMLGRDGDWPALLRRITSKNRRAYVKRSTNETNIEVSVDLAQTGPVQIETGIGFFDHMLEQLGRHGGFALDVKVTGDLHVDAHHTVEDTALAIGQALASALGEKRGIARYGFLLPMDESLATVSLDLSGRAHTSFNAEFPADKVGELPTALVPHFFRSLCASMGATLHMEVRGQDTHHMVEAAFKGFARTLRTAIEIRSEGIPSTKGVL